MKKKKFLFSAWIFLNTQKIFWATLDDFFWTNKPKNLVELKSIWSWSDVVLTVIAQVVDLILYFAWTIAVWFIIYWWIRIITDFWTEDWISEAKKIVLHSIIWLLVIFISVILVENTDRFVKFVVWGGTL